ncbi:4-phosphoerythronate dehydrogenase [Pseudoalteromonas piscicida]|uniref:Erythronate-4-phosphate dehydrogenase n=1 Tax=Pseudoalteromonas piscicida TaxID=43662 RepID=A0A2A5JUQ4_PSEO7|nr:4-phosphoerythronate dehydrogenase [Pseudoalteromonas piscicida]PCK33203.1 erythronate-4-phosphate dehydrogenase [Pseudoalteromonas piscicida]
MQILADQNMPLVESFFSDIGEVQRFDGRNLQPEALREADVLLTRSVTKVNEALLAQAKQLKFVGTATIGVDHIDTQLLKNSGIAFSSAPGCNAIAVAEYVISGLLAYAQETCTVLQGKTIAIVGVGNIGKCLAEKVKGLGLKVLLCDPVRNQAGDLESHVELDEALTLADIVSFHVPLVKNGEHKTVHLLDKARIASLKPGMVVVNASRGDVIDNQALLSAVEKGQQLELILDVWENEPTILQPLLDHTRFASVHIAGHTLEGKARGTQMLYEAVCREFALQPHKTINDFLAQPSITECLLKSTASEQDIIRLVHLVYDIRRDDGMMRAQLSSQGFDALRKAYPVRREFSTIAVNGDSPISEKLFQLGFSERKR